MGFRGSRRSKPERTTTEGGKALYFDGSGQLPSQTIVNKKGVLLIIAQTSGMDETQII